VEERREDHEHAEREHPPAKIAPGPKLPKPAVPHVYLTLGLGFGWEERMPPER
jgi:hypothetical protein